MLLTCHLLTSLIIWYFLNNVIIFFIAQLLVNLLIIECNVHTKRTIDRKADAVTPIPPNVETRRTPSEEQLAHVLESALRDDLVQRMHLYVEVLQILIAFILKSQCQPVRSVFQSIWAQIVTR